MKIVKALIPTGLGFNCEYESHKAFELAGARPHVIDIRDLVFGKVNLFDYDVLFLIGGFSFGDDLGSGKAAANLLRYNKIKGRRFIDIIREFVLERGKVVMGICNGFQVLMKLGILPGLGGNFETQTCTITANDSGQFEDRWVHLKIIPDRCIATKGIESIYLPVRHGEGKVIAKTDLSNRVIAQYAEPLTLEPTQEYPFNPNGSPGAIAGIADETGRIFGMMPHPEAFLYFEHHPHWTRLKRELKIQGEEMPKYGEGLQIFRNVVEWFS